MSTVRRIYSNLLYLSGAEFISKVLQFVLMIYAARLLDPANFGKFSFALALSSIGIIFSCPSNQAYLMAFYMNY